MFKSLSVYLQSLLPQHGLTRLIGQVADCKIPWLKNFLIRRFIALYKIDLALAESDNLHDYPSFNHFFIRKLKSTARPLVQGQKTIASPADGSIAAIGNIQKNQLLQVKHFYFDLDKLLGGHQALAETFYDGTYVTIYLAPHDYHRVHMPLTGTLQQTLYVPGKLFSVNRTTTERIPELYSRNERLISVFSTEVGEMAVILVGAMIVGNIKTVWMSQPLRSLQHTITPYTDNLTLNKGDELGYFNMGSTVIVLFQKNKVTWSPALQENSLVQFGQLIGNISAN